MAQALSEVYIHLTFSTYGRRRYLHKEIRPRVFACMAEILKNLNAAVLQIGGTDDHVHILFRLPKDVALMQIIMKVKANSSRFVKQLDGVHDSFAWQGGYYAGSVSPRALGTVVRYIATQEKHHRTESYQQEVLRQIAEDGAAVDTEKLWD